MKSLSPALVSAVLLAVLFFAAACPRQGKPAAPPDASGAAAPVPTRNEKLETRNSGGAAATTFTNPIAAGADPWVIRHNGKYYWTLTDTPRGIAIWCSDSPAAPGTRKVVWHAPKKGPRSREIWAPELHHLDGRWYIYAAADNGNNATHRMIVLQSATDDPLSAYTYKATLYTGDHIDTQEQNRWAVDGTVFTHDGKRYFIWSGWEDDRDRQYLYIAPMSNPWTISGNRVRLCADDDYPWERLADSPQCYGLNEAPEILRRGDRVFLVYSASGSWQTTYKMGLLELTGPDPLAPGAWRKHPAPVFAPTQTTFGVGHASFTKSPDGTQDWIIYHAKQDRKDGWGRVIHAQPFTWTKDGFPDFGTPVAADKPLPLPSDKR